MRALCNSSKGSNQAFVAQSRVGLGTQASGMSKRMTKRKRNILCCSLRRAHRAAERVHKNIKSTSPPEDLVHPDLSSLVWLALAESSLYSCNARARIAPSPRHRLASPHTTLPSNSQCGALVNYVARVPGPLHPKETTVLSFPHSW